MYPIKICFLTPFPPKEDGVAEYSRCLVDSLQNKGTTIFVVTQNMARKSTSEKPSFERNVRIFEIWNPKSIINQFKIFRQILGMHPNIVHIQYGPYSGYGGLLGEPLFLLLVLLKLSRLCCIVTLHSIWLPQEVTSRVYEKLKSTFLSKLASIYYYFFMKIFLKSCNLVLVCVNFNRSAIAKQIIELFGLPNSKVHQIVHGSANPISLQQKLKAKEKLGVKGKILLCTGFVRPDKGYEYAIEALDSLKKKNMQLKLIIAGTPNTMEGWNYLSSLKKQGKKLHLSGDVIFDTRYLPEKDLLDYFASSDLLLLPYSRRVGPSGPLAIAASSGLPTIMTVDPKFALSNVSPFVKLVPPKNSKALASMIEKMFDDDQTMEKMVNEALAFSSKYSFDEVARQHILLYSSMLTNEAGFPRNF